jgi:hypothetical protein
VSGEENEKPARERTGLLGNFPRKADKTQALRPRSRATRRAAPDGELLR